MLLYTRAYLRPDGLAPLIGDTDSGQVLPFVHRRADEHAYLLEIGAVVFDDPSLAETRHVTSQAFPQAGTYIMRDEDLIFALTRAVPAQRPWLSRAQRCVEY